MTTATSATPTTPQPSTSQDDLAALVRRGSEALQSGDLRGALESFETVIAAFPDRPEGHNNLGALYSSLGEFAKAEAAFDRVLEILPHNANILYNRGVVRSRQEKFEPAREDFQAALKNNPEDADIHNNLGVIEFARGRLKQARKHFRKAGRIDPGHRNVVLNLCDVELAEGDTAAAIDLLEAFLERQSDLEVRRRLLDLLSQECRQALERASREAETLLRTDTGNQQARIELGRLIEARSALTAVSGQAVG